MARYNVAVEAIEFNVTHEDRDANTCPDMTTRFPLSEAVALQNRRRYQRDSRRHIVVVAKLAREDGYS